MFRVVVRVYSCPRFVLKVCALEVYGILRISCSDVSIFVDLLMCYLMTAYLNILPELGKNYSFLFHEGKEKLCCCLEKRTEELRFFFLKHMLLCEIDYILEQHKIILVEFRISVHVGFWNLPETG